ncbi:hypothetical protein GCM10010269_66300 [Streptomyces humidus]|uniref:Uncharacterized protein n=1 Tax=Streptomyces humidus TaxID=52259 RepID=A0A918L7T5_9ACTN|nr:hypothetical protein GCM10010269_66300 [Streptomyces humidus]
MQRSRDREDSRSRESFPRNSGRRPDAGPGPFGLAATAAAFLDAAFGYPIGCDMYLLARRVAVRAK